MSKYRVNIVTASSTSVQVLLGGGSPGKYRLRIVKLGQGNNDPAGFANFLEYRIFVSALSFTETSKYGGSTLKITGQNFSKNLSDN